MGVNEEFLQENESTHSPHTDFACEKRKQDLQAFGKSMGTAQQN